MSVVVITGCSSGIGLATAAKFAAESWTVVATMRDLARSQRLRERLRNGGLEVDIRELDVASDESVKSAIDAIFVDYGGVDVMVSNAGIGSEGTTEELSIGQFRELMETNFLGTVRLLHAVLPAWRLRRSGRFISVGSICGVIGQPFQDAYCASKFAVEGLLESLRPVMAQHGIDVSVLEPGPVKGEFTAKSDITAERPSDNPYAAARAALETVFRRGYAEGQTNDEIGSLLFHIGTVDRPALRYQSSEMIAKMTGLKLKDLSGERLLGMTAGWIA